MRKIFFLGLFFLIVLNLLSCTSQKQRPGPNFSEKELREGVLVCFGNSLTEGQGAAPEEAYPAVLQKKLPFRVVNAGQSGETTQEALARLGPDVLAFQPKIVVVEFGANDFFYKVPVEEAEKNLINIIHPIQKKGACVILAGTPLNWEYHQMFARVAKKMDCELLPNALEGIIDHEELMSDPIHPNKDGYYLMARLVYQAINNCLKKAGFPNIINEKF